MSRRPSVRALPVAPLLTARMLVAIALSAAALLPLRSARGQAAGESAISLAAGVASASAPGTGLYVGAMLESGLKRPGLSTRIEGAAGLWTSSADRDRSNRVYTLGAALVQRLGRGAIQPYVVGGAAVYISDEREPLGGLNGGVGARFRVGASSMFAEARAHRRIAAVGGRFFVPLTVGVTF